MVGPGGDPRRVRLLLAGGAKPREPGLGGSGGRSRGWRPQERTRRRLKGAIVLGGPGGRGWWCLPVGCLVALLGESPLPVLVGAVAVPVAGRSLTARRARGAAQRREEAVIELCAALSGELRAGRTPDLALLAVDDAVIEGLGEGGAALRAAARFAGDVPGALRAAAHQPGLDGLRGVAACWRVAVEGGAGLAPALDRVAGALRSERDQREELRAQLAGPRATALILALLPVFGLLLGGAMGAKPLDVLLHSPAGLLCLIGGALLEWAGLAWVARLVRTAEGTGGSWRLSREGPSGPRPREQGGLPSGKRVAS
ncbi:hypothetical protein E0L36_22410 [Streptomyces sp. AJS327]|nr:hypothetical protein [Streptomyces sp. AJS327]